MKRRLLTILCATSFLLFAAVCVLWVRSYYAGLRLVVSGDWQLRSDAGRVEWNNTAAVFRAEIQQARYNAQVARGRQWPSASAVGPPPPSPAHPPRAPAPVRISIRYALLALLTVAAPSIWLASWWRSRGRYRSGLCRTCGYDLRATPGRCPECGMGSTVTTLNHKAEEETK